MTPKAQKKNLLPAEKARPRAQRKDGNQTPDTHTREVCVSVRFLVSSRHLAQEALWACRAYSTFAAVPTSSFGRRWQVEDRRFSFDEVFARFVSSDLSSFSAASCQTSCDCVALVLLLASLS